MKALTYVKKMESQINLILKGIPTEWNQPKASVWTADNYNIAMKICSGQDIYELLESENTITKIIKNNPNEFVILTCGWAAPLDTESDDNTPPSQHSRKRRVRLVVGATKDGVASVLRFQDNPDEVVTDENTARGSLADAIHQLHTTIKEMRD